MKMIPLQFLKQFDHRVGNGTTVFYAPGDSGEFDEPLANSLVFECIAVPATSETGTDAEASSDEQKSEGDAPANKAKKAAPANKAKK